MSDRETEVRGLLLWLEPVGWSGALFGVALPRMWEAVLGGRSADPGAIGVRLILLAAVLRAISARLPLRTRALALRWQTAVSRRGGEAHPPQPVYVPSWTEQGDDPMREPGRTLTGTLYAFMRDPGGSARRWLAAIGLMMLLEAQWELWLRIAGQPPPMTPRLLAGALLVALATTGCVVLLLDVRRGRLRAWRRPLRSARAGYPAAWAFQPRATRLPSLPMALLLVGLLAMWEVAVHQPTFDQAIDQVGVLLTMLTALWSARTALTAVRPIEVSVWHHRLWRLTAALVRIGWHVVRGLMALLAAAIVLLLSLGLAAADQARPALELGVVMLALRLACSVLVRDWRRPEFFLQASSEEIVTRTTDPAVARRMSALLGAVVALWAAVRFL